MLNKRIADNKEALYIVNFFKKKSDFFAVIMINYGKTGNTKGAPEGTP